MYMYVLRMSKKNRLLWLQVELLIYMQLRFIEIIIHSAIINTDDIYE